MREVFVKAEDTNWGLCPKCGSDQVEGGSIDVVGTMTIQGCTCFNCDHDWDEHYTALARVWYEDSDEAVQHADN